MIIFLVNNLIYKVEGEKKVKLVYKDQGNFIGVNFVNIISSNHNEEKENIVFIGTFLDF